MMDSSPEFSDVDLKSFLMEVAEMEDRIEQRQELSKEDHRKINILALFNAVSTSCSNK